MIKIANFVERELFEDCDDAHLFIDFAPDGYKLSGFGTLKVGRVVKYPAKDIPIKEVEESNLKKWMMMSVLYSIDISNDLGDMGLVTVTAKFDNNPIFSFTAPTLDAAMEGLEVFLNNFDFGKVSELLMRGEYNRKEVQQKENTKSFFLGLRKQ